SLLSDVEDLIIRKHLTADYLDSANKVSEATRLCLYSACFLPIMIYTCDNHFIYSNFSASSAVGWREPHCTTLPLGLASDLDTTPLDYEQPTVQDLENLHQLIHIDLLGTAFGVLCLSISHRKWIRRM
ncbi:hypothetical protein GN958_ATG10952, partial [Phytophthora infestans]